MNQDPIGPQRATPATVAQIRAQMKQVLSQLAESDSRPLEKENAMPLFHIQDPDRPAWVIAENYAEAEQKWRNATAKENDGYDAGPPQGIAIVCKDEEIIIDEDWLA